jgi:hypothetical protein
MLLLFANVFICFSKNNMMNEETEEIKLGQIELGFVYIPKINI